MSFNSNAPRAEYTATAGQTVFPFIFKIYTDANIVAYKTVGSADPLLLQLTTDYTVTINGDEGGEITLLVGADEDDVITILRDLPITRDIEYQTSGDMRAETLNDDQEYQTYLIADQNDQIAALEAGDVGVSSFVQRTGDTMTGHLKGVTPVSDEDLARKDYIDDADNLKLNLAGGTVTGQIKGITPAADADLSRKDYVDGITATKLNASGDAPMFACRAWINFNGTGTIAIRDSGNVDSITDNGTGDYTVTLTEALEDTNACVVATQAVGTAAHARGCEAYMLTTTTISVKTYGGGSSEVAEDMEYISLAVFR